MTMLSQNAVRNRKNITLPLVFHGVFTAVEETLAEPLEGEVGSVASILRMLETSCPRLFLKFERFSSLKKRTQMQVISGARPARWQARALNLRANCGLAIVLPPFGNRPFTILRETDGAYAVA